MIIPVLTNATLAANMKQKERKNTHKGHKQTHTSARACICLFIRVKGSQPLFWIKAEMKYE